MPPSQAGDFFPFFKKDLYLLKTVHSLTVSCINTKNHEFLLIIL